MPKGKMVELFSVGQWVEFTTTERKDFSPEGRKHTITYPEVGIIVKLYPRAGSNGAAKLRRHNGTTCVRRLQNVRL